MRIFLITTSIILLAGAGYFTYEKWSEPSNLTPWSFIPESSAVIYESNQAYHTLLRLEEQEIWKTLNNIKGFEKLGQNIDQLEEITNNQLASLLDNNPLLISMNPISRDEIDFLFVLEINSLPTHSVLATIQEHFQKQFPKKRRTYLGFELVEIIGLEETFTFMFHKNYLIGSFSAFLVEDAIRSLQNETSPFVEQFPQMNTVAKLQNDEGNLYINIQVFEDLIDNFSEIPSFSPGNFAFLDIQSANQSIQLNGFTFLNDEDGFLSTHVGITPGAFDLVSITPMQTSYVFHYSFSDSESWGTKQQAYLKRTQPNIWSSAAKLQDQVDLDINYLYSLLDEEIGLLHFERLAGTDKAMILEVSDQELATSYFDDISRQLANAQGDTLYIEQYRGLEIKHMMAEEFPSTLLGESGLGFPSAFYFTINNFIVFSNSPNQLQKIIDAIREENTWAKSLRKNEFLSRINQASNFSIFVNTPEFWSRMQKSINPYWKSSFSDNSTLLKSLDNVAIQFSNIDGRFFTNFVISQSETPVSSAVSPERLKTAILVDKIISKPYLKRSTITNEIEILIQDSSTTLYQFNEELELNWEVPVSGRINSDIHQIDYYKNNNQQFVFTTKNQLHIIDQNGLYLPGFPKTVESLDTISHFSVIDYNGSKNYRFSFSDQSGNIYLSDKNGKILDGWNPNPVGQELLRPLYHARIGKLDVMMAFTKPGQIHLKNRRGESFPSFPIDFKSPIMKSYHLKSGNNFQNSSVSWTTQEGEWIEVDLNGKIIRRDQLFKPAASTTFSILNDQSGEHFLITSKDELALRILDPKGEELFSKSYLDVESDQQFYRITAGKELVVIRDLENERIHIFNLEGRLLTGGPLEGSQQISLVYNSKEDIADLYIAYKKELRKLRLSSF
ncbi:MAG: DUF3352 domain-containing protein [Cytophagales bacterium]|nr:DUF3352 domain-containing protein [Cytophagales bacterium]